MIHNEDIVISGISGRLPESSNIEEFKYNLMNEIDMVTDDERRWSGSAYGISSKSGKIKDLSSFDASFFGIHAKQAHVMDPQVRLLLEVTYEALIDAGINPITVRKSRTGVFVALSVSESDEYWMQAKSSNDLTGYELLGSYKALAANRISFAFDFIGPSYTLDTASSSSMSTLHVARSAISNGECDAAIVAGLNLLLRPEYSVSLTKLGALAQNGKCKSFDVTADGYARAEAITAIYLQKAKNARRIYATVVHSKTNADGYKPEGITYPNGQMHHQLLREIYRQAEIDPADIPYVESHCTGTIVGDPEEANCIDQIFCKNRKTPLLIGSVKSNMGHAEAEQRQTAGLPGLAIQWGAVGDTGLYMNTVAGNDAFWNDVLPQRIYSCLETADIFLQQSHQILCSTVLAEKGKHVNDRSDNLVKSIANILRVKDINSIEDDSFVNLGMDSLGYIEVKNVLEIKFDIHLSSEEIRSLTFAKLRNLSISNAKDK
ncbi:hypothetical protein HN011_010567 [Eciton burchellii]|nr:hypothetical protein HN011_010567 [Eciton burchellii]